MGAKSYLVYTYGCQMNEADSEVLAGILEEMGYTPAESREEANLILLNTCAVRKKAEDKVLSRIGEMRSLKEEKPEMLIAVGGCAVQQPELAEKIRVRYPFVDLVFGTHALPRFQRLLEQAEKSDHTVIDIEETEEDREGLPRKREGFKAWVNITYGCNNFCSYCIVPYVRGRERSRRPVEILREVEQMVDEGVVEVTLLGQNVNSYGRDLGTGIDFADLLQEIDRVEGIRRIRYTTSHPRDFSQKLVDTIASSQHICDHFHLPAQAGSNKVLKDMNRGYTRESYLKLVKEIRDALPDASITTDLIVGFPGETEEDFQQTLDLVEQVRFDSAYTFMYSPRKGTPAALREDQVAKDVKKDRIQRLIGLQNKIGLEQSQRFLNRVEEVLVEGLSKTDGNMLTGRTTTNKVVNFPVPEWTTIKPGHFVPVKITLAKTFFLLGEVVERVEAVSKS